MLEPGASLLRREVDPPERLLEVWRQVGKPEGELTCPLELLHGVVDIEKLELHPQDLKLAEKWELRDGNPVSRTDLPKTDGRDPVVLSDEEYERLLAECRERSWMLYLYALTCGETGARCESEVFWL